MGIERLNSAAHAAGFAMVSAEEAFEDFRIEGKVDARSDSAQWQPSKSVLIRDTSMAGTDWVSLLLGLLGRRTPARRPALTAEA